MEENLNSRPSRGILSDGLNDHVTMRHLVYIVDNLCYVQIQHASFIYALTVHTGHKSYLIPFLPCKTCALQTGVVEKPLKNCLAA